MGKQIKFSEAKIIGENKNFNSIEGAKYYYEKQRMNILASSWLPENEYPDGFKVWMLKLIKFCNPVSMNVWHNRAIKVEDNGVVVCTTWDNLCTFQRRFNCAEMYQCLEILKRATPNEVYSVGVLSEVDYFNEVVFPKLESIAYKLQTTLYEIEEQLCKPIRDKINCDIKLMLKLPITDKVEFIKAKERRM